MNIFSLRDAKNCPARLIKSTDPAKADDPTLKGTHQHAPDARSVERKRVLNQIKCAAKVDRASARRIIADNVADLSEATAAVMPSTTAMRNMITRARNKIDFPKNPTSLADLVIGEQFRKTAKGNDFLLFDNEDSVKRLLIFATHANLRILSQCRSVYMDGTFAVTPPLFKQLYTIHGKSYIEALGIVTTKIC